MFGIFRTTYSCDQDFWHPLLMFAGGQALWPEIQGYCRIRIMYMQHSHAEPAGKTSHTCDLLGQTAGLQLTGIS